LINVNISATREEVRKFGYMFAGICVLIGAYTIYKGQDTWLWFAAGAGFFLMTGLIGYPILRPVYLVWMKFAYVLGWINMRVLLGVFFFLILTPIGAMMRLFGKDLLDEKIDRSAGSYWKERSPVPLEKERYERLF
jgi:hypothetical protein